MDTQITAEQVQAIFRTTIPGLVDATVERHYWTVMALTGEAMVNVLRDPFLAEEDGAAKIAECERAVDDFKRNAVAHAPVPADQLEQARVMFEIAQLREKGGQH